MPPTTRWIIAADDRTGALEVAGMCSIAGAPSLVTTELRSPTSPILVIDLGTRHASPENARERAAAVEVRSWASIVPAQGTLDARAGHKVDSLLRGNWAVELVARQRTGGRRVVLVPAFPAMGRTCIGGVVRADGVPVGDLPDARRGARTSRPAEALDAVELDVGTLDTWLRGDGPIAVCDASTDGELRAIAGMLDRHPDVLVAGPAGALAAAAHGSPAAPRLPLGAPALVVCGSLHPMARRQLAALDGLPGVTVLATDAAPRDDAEAVAAQLATRAIERLDDVATLVLVGGDTAAAVLGPGDVTVSGTVEPGMPWCARALDRDVQLVTKAGGFGDDGSLARLFGAG